MSRPNKRLWKEVGITKQKFDRQSDMSPSFDGSSVAKSRQGRSVSSHDSSVNKRNEFKSKVQSKSRLEAAQNNFIAQINQLRINLMQVPQQQDIQSMRNSVISMKQSFSGNCHEQSQLEILNQLFKKNNVENGKKVKVERQKLIRLISQARRIEFQHSQTQKCIKHQLDSYRVQKRKNDRVIREITKRMTDSIYARDDSIERLTFENEELKKQLFKAYDFIDELQKQKEAQNVNNKYSRFTPNSLKTIVKQEDDRTVKLRDKKKQLAIQIQQMKNKNNFHQTADTYFKGISYKRNSEPNPVWQYQGRPVTSYQFNSPKRPQENFKKDFDTFSNREKFKKYLHQRKKRELIYEKSEDFNKKNNTQSGLKAIKYKKQGKQFAMGCQSIKQIAQNSFSLNINSLTQKFFQKHPMVSVKKDHKDCDSNARIERLKSETFLKYNSHRR